MKICTDWNADVCVMWNYIFSHACTKRWIGLFVYIPAFFTLAKWNIFLVCCSHDCMTSWLVLHHSQWNGHLG